MRALRVLAVLLTVAIVATVAKGGHELPVYPSYYPHEIEIRTAAPEQAAGLLLQGGIQAYVGGTPRFAEQPPDWMRSVESLGAMVSVRVNPASSLVHDEGTACAVARTILRDIAGRGEDLVFHPYPVTPFHGDYLDHVDLADAAKARVLGDTAEPAKSFPHTFRVAAEGPLAKSLVRPEWYTQGSDWDAAIEETDAAQLVASSLVALNGWLGPPWVRTGWFQADLLLADAAAQSADASRARNDLERLQAGDYADAIERINLERELVSTLTSGCRKVIAGYTVKREYLNAEFSAGIENVAYDSVAGLHSPMFIRTVKLKDFPWNGWLSLGINARPSAAWNPIAGFNDPFGRLVWFALADPAVLPAPNDARWTINRIADVQSSAGK
jgi:hypothetical protein